MVTQDDEYELRKKAIFDTMSKRGQERILRIGYENWEPFEMPKDPRERIFSAASLRANALVKEFYASKQGLGESADFQKDLFDLCRGLLQEERRAESVLEFCLWFHKVVGKS